VLVDRLGTAGSRVIVVRNTAKICDRDRDSSQLGNKGLDLWTVDDKTCLKLTVYSRV
jgi:hypothetical protein